MLRLPTIQCFLVATTMLCAQLVYGQVPIYNSLPGSPYVVFLDFDGQVITGTSWNVAYNSGNPINCNSSGFNSSQMTQVHQMVSEDYRPFNINVTTDSTVFAAAPLQQKIRVLVTRSSSWYPSVVGGVAYYNSFSSAVNNVCFVFVNNLSNNPGYTAEAISHEAGHSFSLAHHSEYNSSCTKVNEYLQGYGSGETSWAPIMGVGYYKNMTTWGNTASDATCDISQNDLAKITGSINRGVAFRTDDRGNDLASALPLNIAAGIVSDSGMIETPNDLDAFSFLVSQPSQVNITVNPWNYGSGNSKADLDVKLVLKNDTGRIFKISEPRNSLSASTGNIQLPPGNYVVLVDGDANDYQSGYGSLGKYYCSGTIADAMSGSLNANFIVNDSNVCSGTLVQFSDQSIGTPTSWSWSFPGGTPSSSSEQFPDPVAYASTGSYTVSLTVSDGVQQSTKTISNAIRVNALPNLSFSPTQPIVCGNVPAEISASGASFYQWTPAASLTNSSLSRVRAFPTSNQTYTLTGTDLNGCSTSMLVPVSYFPAPVLSKIPNSDQVFNCLNDSVQLQVSGATTYDWSPSTGLNYDDSAVVKASPPLGNFYYSITGTDANGCKAFASFSIITRNCDSLMADFKADSNAICVGNCISFTDFSTGHPTGWSWSFPGGTPSSSSSQNPGPVCYSAAGNYTVSLTIFKDTSTHTRTVAGFVGVGEVPDLNITATRNNICIGDSSLLKVTGAQTYAWTNHPTLSYILSDSVKVRPLGNTTYYVSGTNFATSQGGGTGGGGFKRCINNDSIVIFARNCVLPVQLLDFSGQLQGNMARLNWQIAAPEELQWQEIQISKNGFYFEPIVRWNGSTESRNTYLDSASVRLFWPNRFYRLKLVGVSGEEFYSKVISFSKNDSPAFIQLSPNPAHGAVNVRMYATQSQAFTMRLTDLSGKLLIQRHGWLHSGTNVHGLNIAHLPGGMYLLQCQSGTSVQTLRLMKF